MRLHCAQYSGAGEGKPLPTVLVAVTGAIDRGACIRDFSQYPAEVGSENVAEHAYKF